MEERKKNIGRIIINIFIFIIIVLVSLFFFAKYIGTEGVITREYKISSEFLPSNFSGIKIVHFSDVLYKGTNDLDRLDETIQKINILKPDIVVFTGGLSSTKISKKVENKIIEILNKITYTLGMYAIKGDIDYNENYTNIMNSSGFKILDNQYDLIYNKEFEPILIAGVSSLLKNDVDFNKVFETLEEETPLYKILLIHEGDTIKNLNETDYKFNLILGGHSLNGSVIMPFYGPIFIPRGSKKYFSKNYVVNDTQVYISGGLGTDKYDLRLFNNPSFNLYRLKSLQ